MRPCQWPQAFVVVWAGGRGCRGWPGVVEQPRARLHRPLHPQLPTSAANFPACPADSCSVALPGLPGGARGAAGGAAPPQAGSACRWEAEACCCLPACARAVCLACPPAAACHFLAARPCGRCMLLCPAAPLPRCTARRRQAGCCNPAAARHGRQLPHAADGAAATARQGELVGPAAADDGAVSGADLDHIGVLLL